MVRRIIYNLQRNELTVERNDAVIFFVPFAFVGERIQTSVLSAKAAISLAMQRDAQKLLCKKAVGFKKRKHAMLTFQRLLPFRVFVTRPCYNSFVLAAFMKKLREKEFVGSFRFIALRPHFRKREKKKKNHRN